MSRPHCVDNSFYCNDPMFRAAYVRSPCGCYKSCLKSWVCCHFDIFVTSLIHFESLIYRLPTMDVTAKQNFMKFGFKMNRACPKIVVSLFRLYRPKQNTRRALCTAYSDCTASYIIVIVVVSNLKKCRFYTRDSFQCIDVTFDSMGFVCWGILRVSGFKNLI